MENYIRNSNNIFIILFLIFVSGIAQVFLPCTYPLLSITISIFGITDNVNRKTTVLSALLFIFGIITTYTFLGAIVSVAGFLFNKTIIFGSIGYNPIVLSILVLLFLYFTFSMSGFYDIQIPNFLIDFKSNVYAKKNKSIFYKYIMGLITGIVATPCATPIIAIILEIGFLNPIFSAVYMFTYALGFSLVLFILSLFTSIIRNMPKAGKWMVYVKYVFTFLMLLISFYYANILFIVLGFNNISYIFSSLTLFVFAFIVYFIRRNVMVLSFFEIKLFIIVFALSIIIGFSYGYIKSNNNMNDYIPYNLALDISKNTNKPIFIDFSAIWCANCYELKDKVLKNRDLKKFIDDNFIFTEIDIDKNKDISDKFNIRWLPFIIVIDSNNNILYMKNSFSSFDDEMAISIKNDIERIIKN